jgi:predicted amidohydrolase YtcJ
MVLDAFEHAAAAGPGVRALRDRRFRIEHAQVLSPADIPRFMTLGVIASMQPTHCTSDMPWAPARLGAERIHGAYAWRQLLEIGARLALGSDFPVESPDPLLGVYAAVTTQDLDGHPPGGYRPGEKLTIWEALRGFTSDAAYAASAENELGRAAPGYRADLAVFDRDLTSIPPREIPKARCVLTMVGGEIVWRGKR